MIVSLIQMSIVHNDVEANLSKASKLIGSHPGSDLYIMPEFFATGYIANPTKLADEAYAITIERMKRMARTMGASIAGSVVRPLERLYYNSFVVCRPDGSVATSDKRHLFTMGGESERYTAGKERIVVEIGGFRLLLLICYDIRFPVWSRCRGTSDYDAIVYVANWSTTRIDTWDILLRARAIENQAYVLGVNRVGSEGSSEYNGHSAVIDPYGTIIAGGEEGIEEVITAKIDKGVVEEYRNSFRVFPEADAFGVGVH